MCPYARFQSAMFDHDTLLISYDQTRGEPRGSRHRGADSKSLGLGDCIDCTLCVQVCPTGIDIREGLQIECIACAACIDVCDQVMDRMGYPRGLIRYTTENALQGKHTRVLRPRIFVYASLLLLIIGGSLWSMTHRIPLRADLVRDRNALYRELPGGLIENVYTLNVTNMDAAAHEYRLLAPPGSAAEIELPRALRLDPEKMAGFPLRIRVPRSWGQGAQTLPLQLVAGDDPAISKSLEARLLLPVSQQQ
jgi:cytochrome c oxidase accessory protein FixG